MADITKAAETVAEIERRVYAEAVVKADADVQREMFRLEFAREAGENADEQAAVVRMAEMTLGAMVMLLKTTQADEPDIQSIDGWVVRAYVLHTGYPPGYTPAGSVQDPQTCVECNQPTKVTIQGMCTSCRNAYYDREEEEDRARELNGLDEG